MDLRDDKDSNINNNNMSYYDDNLNNSATFAAKITIQ